MKSSRYYLDKQPIPKGFQIYEGRLPVAGITFRKRAVLLFATSKHNWIEFEREPKNKHDQNAIKVLGCYKGLFRIKRRLIGYIPREISKKIVDGQFWGEIKPRLLHTYVSENQYVEVFIQILGPTSRIEEYFQG